jgi:hypothetical protein
MAGLPLQAQRLAAALGGNRPSAPPKVTLLLGGPGLPA